MTLPEDFGSEKRFVSVVLPWVIAGVALVVYLITLNHWLSLGSLTTVATVSGWNWQPDWNGPLYWLITLPFRALPAKTIPVALNLLSAVCAALTIQLLARSVSLLPQDRTEEQRLRERSPFGLLSIPTAWVPPVLAVLVCGFQLTFWEHATVASREMFELLLFAYVVRCLLEFRICGRDVWLLKAALVYGAGMAENWAMIGFFPLFLVALVWLKGVSFFNGGFLGRMFVMGSIGLLAYLLLPLIDSFTSVVPMSFWQALKLNLASQKQALFALPFSRWALLHGFTGDQPLWVLALPSLLPVLALSIRWPSYFGDTSRLGTGLATLVFHFLHALLLVVCLWVALDPEKFGPRHLLPGLPMLTLYYLGALSVGYYSGYFLLIFGGTKIQRRVPRPVPSYQGLVNLVVMAAVVILALGTPLALLYRNLPQIRVSNGPMWRNYADLLVQPVQGQNAILMSDDLPHLLLAEAGLVQKGRGKEYIFLDTGSLRDWLPYHKYLSQRYRQHWPGSPPPVNAPGTPEPGKISGLYLVQLAMKMAETNSTYYLHPSFGYYFEVFYPERQGLIYKLQQYPPSAFTQPAVPAEQREKTEKFWSEVDDSDLKPVLSAIQTQPQPEMRRNWPDNLLHRMHLTKEANPEAVFLASLYSRSLVDWGVTMQRSGQLKEAAAHFTRALDLNPDNVVAQVNLDCNRSLQSGGKAVIDLPKAVEERMGRYRTLENVMNANGPFDEPTFCFQQGRAFLRGGNYRQAGQELIRVKELIPDNLSSRLLLSQIYLFSQMPDQALTIVDEIHRNVGAVSLDRTNHLELLAVEATAYLAKGDVAAADSAIQKVLVKYPQDEQVLGLATRSFMNFGWYTNALSMLDLELKMNPTNEAALINRGVALLRINRSAEAIAPLTEVLRAESTNLSSLHYAALINRAIAYLQTGKLDDSQHDYEELQRALPTDYRLDYGLGEIAYRRKDTNAAIRCYDNYMRNAPINAPEIKRETGIVIARLKELRPDAGSRASSDNSKNGATPSTGTNQTSNSKG